MGLTFVGPPAEVIRRGGSKIGARALARSIGVPVGEGSDRAATADEAAAARRADRLPGAAQGVGGRRRPRHGPGRHARPACATPSTPPPARPRPRSATAPCSSSAGSATPATSRCRSSADTHGSVIHLGERDCSAQRRLQKIVEEAPASALPDDPARRDLRRGHPAGQGAGYVGAGTVEFLVDVDRRRLLVPRGQHAGAGRAPGHRDDHRRRHRPRAAAHRRGRPLSSPRRTSRSPATRSSAGSTPRTRRGLPAHARPDRALDDARGRGRARRHALLRRLDGRAALRLDDRQADLLGRATGTEALRRMDRALAHVAVEGVATTAGVARDLVRHGDFRANRINTRWIEDRFLPQWRTNRVRGSINGRSWRTSGVPAAVADRRLLPPQGR